MASQLAVGAVGVGAACCTYHAARQEAPRFRALVRRYTSRDSVAARALVDLRRDALFAQGAVRAGFCRAFLAVSAQHAPVPLTFFKAAMGSYWSILATALGGCAPEPAS